MIPTTTHPPMMRCCGVLLGQVSVQRQFDKHRVEGESPLKPLRHSGRMTVSNPYGLLGLVGGVACSWLRTIAATAMMRHSSTLPRSVAAIWI